jgi:predicted phage tail protein
MPVIAGAGGKGLSIGTILLGVALVALAFVPGIGIGLQTVAGQAAAGFTAAGKVLLTLGATLALTGIAQLITPVTKTSQGSGSDNDPRKTYNFSGIQQTSRQGVPVPCVYGLTLVGSVTISAGTDTVQVKA